MFVCLFTLQDSQVVLFVCSLHWEFELCCLFIPLGFELYSLYVYSPGFLSCVVCLFIPLGCGIVLFVCLLPMDF